MCSEFSVSVEMFKDLTPQANNQIRCYGLCYRETLLGMSMHQN